MSLTPRPPHEPPEIGVTGEEIYTNTDYTNRDRDELDSGYAWRRFIGALSELLDPIADVVRPNGTFDDDARWTVLADPDLCPTAWLPVLAQWAGIRRPDAYTEQQLRQLIARGGPGFFRGTRAGMIAEIRRFLPPGTPDSHIYFEERADGNPYKLRVFTYTFEDHDPELVRQALAFAKPAGLYPFEYEVRVGQTWAMLNHRKQNWAQVKADYANWYEVLHDEPIDIEET